jgi:hypothetical protein
MSWEDRIPVERCPTAITWRWLLPPEPDSPPIEPPTREDIRARKEERNRAEIDRFIDEGKNIYDLILYGHIPAGQLIELYREIIGELPKFDGRDITIKSICKMRKGRKENGKDWMAETGD